MKKRFTEEQIVAILRDGQVGAQRVAHLQAFSNATVDEILTQIKDRLPIIAKQAGVDWIVAKVDFQNSNLEIVDVTDCLMAEFSPSERTFEIISELRKQKPLPLVDVVGIQE